MGLPAFHACKMLAVFEVNLDKFLIRNLKFYITIEMFGEVLFLLDIIAFFNYITQRENFKDDKRNEIYIRHSQI